MGLFDDIEPTPTPAPAPGPAPVVPVPKPSGGLFDDIAVAPPAPILPPTPMPVPTAERFPMEDPRGIVARTINPNGGPITRAEIEARTKKPQMTTVVPPGAPVAVPDAGLDERAKAWAHAPGAAVDLAGAGVERGLQAVLEHLGAPHQPGAQLDYENALAELERLTGRDPNGAKRAAEIASGLLPFAVPGAGVPAVLSMGGNKYSDAREAGATEGQALVAGGVATAAGAAAPLAGRAAAPLAERVAAPIADAAGVIPGALTKGAIEGVPQGVVLTGGDAAATAAYDPKAALEELKTIPEAGLEMAIINAIAHGIPAAAITASMRGRALPPVDPNTPDMQHGAPLEPVAPDAKIATTGENAPSPRTAEPSAEEAVSNKTANASTPAEPGLFDDIKLGAQEAPTHAETNEAAVLPPEVAEKLRTAPQPDLRRPGRTAPDEANGEPGVPAANESAPRPVLDAKGQVDVPAPTEAVRPGVRPADVRRPEIPAAAERDGAVADGARTVPDTNRAAPEESRAPERGRVQERVAEPVDAGRGAERVGSNVARGEDGRGEPRPNRDELRSEDAPVRPRGEDHPAAQRGDDRGTTYDNFLARLSDNDAKRLRQVGREARQSKDPAKKRAYIDLKRSLGWTDEHDRIQSNRRRGVDEGQKSVFDEEAPHVPESESPREPQRATHAESEPVRRPEEGVREADRQEEGQGEGQGRQEAVPVREVSGRAAADTEGTVPREAARPTDSGGERASGDRGVPDGTKLSRRAFKTLDRNAGEHEGVLHVTAETAKNLKRVPDAELTPKQRRVREAFRHASVEFSPHIDSRADALYYRDGKGRHVVIRSDANPKDYHRLVGHELTHSMLEMLDPRDKAEFLDSMKNTLQELGKWDKAKAAARERWGDKPEGDLAEEIAAEYGGDLFDDPRAMRRVSYDKPGVFRKMMDAIIGLVRRLTGRDKGSLLGDQPHEAEKELQDAIGSMIQWLPDATKEAIIATNGGPMDADEFGRNMTWIDRTHGSDWVGSYMARIADRQKKLAAELLSSDRGTTVKLSAAKKVLKDGEKEGTLENGARIVNHLTRPEEFGGEARRAGYKLGGSLKAWEAAAHYWVTPSMVAWKHPGESREVYEAIRNRALDEGVHTAQYADKLRPFTSLEGPALKKVARFLLAGDAAGRELELDPKERAKLAPDELAAVEAWRDTMKFALKQRAGRLWEMVGLKPPANPLDAMALRKQIMDDEQELAEHRDEKERLSRRFAYWDRKARVATKPADIAKAAFERDAAERMLSNLGQFTTTDGQPLGVHKARTRLVDTIEQLADAERTAYVPHSWFGDYAHVSITNPKGDVIMFKKAANKGELNNILTSFEKGVLGKGYTATVHDTKAHPEMSSMSEPELRALAKFAGADPKLVDQFLGDGVSDYLKARSNFGAHLIQRRGVAGFSDDLKRVGANYGVSAAKWMANTKLRMTTEPLLDSLNERDQKLAAYWKDHLNYTLTPQQDFNFAREAVYHMFLGGPNVMSAAFNLTQTPMVTLPVYSSLGGMRGVGEVMKAQRVLGIMAARVASAGKLDMTAMAKSAYPDIAADLQWAHDSQVIEGRNRTDFQDMASGLTGAGDQKMAKFVETARNVSSFAFGTTEKTNRLIAFVAGLKIAKEKMDDNGFWRRLKTLGYRGERDARQAAAFLTDTTQYVYGKENRAGFQKGVSGLVFALKSYLINTVHLQYRLARGGVSSKNDAGDRVRFATGAAMMTAVVGSMAGAFGSIPIVGDWLKELTNELVGWIRQDKWNMDDDLEKAMPKFLADTINHGAETALVHAGVLPDSLPNLGQRASVGNFIPTRWNDIGNLSPTADVAVRGKQALFGVSSDDAGPRGADRVPGMIPALRNMFTQPAPNDTMDFVRSFSKLNRGLENLTQGADTLEHGVTSPTTGKTLIPADQTPVSDAAWRALGADTYHVSDAKELSREVHTLATEKEAQKQHLTDNLVEAIWQGEHATGTDEKAKWDSQVDQLIDQIDENNKNATEPSQIIKIDRKGIRKALADRELGLENVKAVPKAIRGEFLDKLDQRH